jgi:hypothetical protein
MSKLEIRNKFESLMTKIQNSEINLQNPIRQKLTLKVSNIGTFEFRYCFAFRASDLEFFGQANAQ